MRGGGEAGAVEEEGGDEDDSLGEGGEHARTTGDPSERERTHDVANEMTGAQASPKAACGFVVTVVCFAALGTVR
jgi:hypothetical protein